MSATLPKSPDAAEALTLLRQRHTLLNELIERMEVYQGSQEILALLLAVEPPVLPGFVTGSEPWQTREPQVHPQ